MKRLKAFFALGITINLCACAQIPINDSLDSSWAPPKMSSYKNAIKSATERRQEYRGFYNKYDVSVTYLNENIRIKQLKLEANYNLWEPDKANTMNEALQESLNQEVKFFISIYTPSRDDNKLNLKSTGWKAKLYFDGQKYNGFFKAIAKDNRDLKFYFPHHTTWSKGYILTFPVPTNVIADKPFHLKFTNPYGAIRLEYNQ